MVYTVIQIFILADVLSTFLVNCQMSSIQMSDGFGDFSILFIALSVFLLFILFIFICAAHGLFPVAVSEGCSFLLHGLLVVVASLVEQGL